MGVEERQCQFVLYGRPGSVLTALLAFGVAEAVAPSRRIEILLGLLLVAALSCVPSILAARRYTPAHVVRVTLAFDVLLLAAMTAVLDEASVVFVPYFAPIAFAALLLGPLTTAAYTVAGAAAGGLVALVVVDAAGLAVLSSLLVLVITGAILTAVSRDMRAAEQRLTREREAAASALRVGERIRSSLALDDVLAAAVKELGTTCRAARCLLRVFQRPDGSSPLFEWTNGAVEPLGNVTIPEPIARVADGRRPRTFPDLDAAEPALREYMAAHDMGSLALYPIVWQERVIAVLGVHDTVPRDWDEEMALLDRVVPQLAAALVQSEAYEQQQLALERLRELAELRESLVANVSHELRTPLTSTLGFLRTLERPDLDLPPEQRARLLSTARAEAERLARLVTDLLDFSKLERGTIGLTQEPVALGPVLAQAAGRVSPEEHARLAIEVPEELTVSADRERLLQVVSNLLSNAFEHGSGRVSVRAEGNGRDVTLLVTDEGQGVPREHLGDLFLPFARWSRRPDSTGLGLAIARGIAHAHGGSLFYRPRTAEQEHAFVLTLPAASSGKRDSPKRREPTVPLTPPS